MNPQTITALIFLLILSIVDIKTFHWKEGAIPKALTTCFVIFMFIFNQNTTILIFSSLIALLLTDIFDVWGFADFKSLVAVSLTFDNIFMVLFFVLMLLAVGFVYQVVIKLLIKYKKIKQITEIPYIPIILITYLMFIF